MLYRGVEVDTTSLPGPRSGDVEVVVFRYTKSSLVRSPLADSASLLLMLVTGADMPIYAIWKDVCRGMRFEQ